MQKNNPTCGAKTRAGTPCKRMPSPYRNRCSLHGGKSLSGGGHPNYKHGFYSKYDLRGITLSQMRRTRRCTEFKADGTPCRQWAMHDDALRRCVAHRDGVAQFERIMQKTKVPRREWEKHRDLVEEYSQAYY
jgi:hypothetical protein